MVFKGPRRHPFGVDLNAGERKVLEAEMAKAAARWDRENETNIEACILWALHVTHGFGAKRLRDFYDGFCVEFERLIKWYEADREESGELAKVKLKQVLDIDIDEWNEESEKRITWGS